MCRAADSLRWGGQSSMPVHGWLEQLWLLGGPSLAAAERKCIVLLG